MSTCNWRKINQPTRRRDRNKKLTAESKTQFPHIPEEILVIILSKLPVKSLLRFRCVSKPCFSLISDPKFKISSPKERAIVLSKPYSPEFSFRLINDDASSIKLPKPEPAMVKWRKFSRGWTIRGSCNGLVLLSCAVDLFLWNPSTRCCKKVLSHEHLQKFDYGRSVSGLCYDSSTDDYKVVMSHWIWSWQLGGNKFMVGSCRTKTWTEVCLPYHGKKNAKAGPIVNERLHFLFVTKSNSNERDTAILVVSFDARANKFVEVPMPKGERGKSALGLGVSDGCLCLALWTEHMSPNENELEVFVMKKYGDRASWISLFVRSNVNGLSGWEPLCFTKDAIVLTKPHRSLVRRICASNGEFTSCQDILVETNNCSYGSKATLVESLVSPPSYNWEEEEEYT